MADPSLVQVLERTVSADQDERTKAQSFLEQAAQTNLAEFLVGLCQVLADTSQSKIARQASGLQIKNYVTSKDESIKHTYQVRWRQLDENSRLRIKQLVLSALGTENTRPSSAAQVVAGIACAEVPHNEWPELMDVLVQNVSKPDGTASQKEAALEAIGYICSDIRIDDFGRYINNTLTAVVHGMGKEENSIHVKLAAANAMLAAIDFTVENFAEANERNFIMQVICEATQVTESQVKVVALQCLVKIVSLYYQHMEAYMAPALFAITMEAIRSTNDEVCLQGIEFWSNICEEEMDLSIEFTEAEEVGKPPDSTSRFYAKGALRYLIPELMLILARQEEMDDEDDWNPSKAAGVCLMLLSSLCEDDVLEFVVPFVTNNIRSNDWRFRDAAVMAFGSILEGPSTEKLKIIVDQGLNTLIELLQDGSVVVRDTTAWAIGRICEMMPESALKDESLRPLLEAMVASLQSEPRVATNICWAFSSLAESAYELSDVSEDDPETYCMSGVYENIIEKLLNTTDRPDGHQNNLRSAAYGAIMEMVKNSPKDCYDTVLKTTYVIMERIHALLQMESRIQSTSDRSQFNDLQSLLCATLQSVLRKVKEEHVSSIADSVMGALLQMLQSSGPADGVQEDALLAVGTLTEVVGPQFMKYMGAFKKYLILGLQNKAEYQVCIAAVGVIGDMARAISREMLPYCDEVMSVLLTNLSDASVHRSVKPHILSVFGDIALSIGTDFSKYLSIVLQTLQQAAEAQVDKANYDMVDYLNELRESCLEAYTGIIQGLKGENEKEISEEVGLMKPHIEFIVSFVAEVASDEDHSEGTVASSAGLIGDLCIAFAPTCAVSLATLIDSKPSIGNLLIEGRRSKTNKTKSLAAWGSKELRKLKTTAQSQAQ